jgi:hypothetical protein
VLTFTTVPTYPIFPSGQKLQAGLTRTRYLYTVAPKFLWLESDTTLMHLSFVGRKVPFRELYWARIRFYWFGKHIGILVRAYNP